MNPPGLVMTRILKYCSKKEIAALFDTSEFFRQFILTNNQKIPNFPIYANQWKAAVQIHQKFIQDSRYVLLTAQPQSGKTGTCQAVAYLIKNNPSLKLKKIWFICGMNDNNLKRQQIREFTGLIPPHQILFSKDLQSYRSPSYFKDSLIILDESHYAQCGVEWKSQHSSMVYRFLTNQVGMTLDGETHKWIGKNLFFLSVSATPMSELVRFIDDENQKTRVILEPGDGYYGFEEMFKNNKVLPSFNLGDEDQQEELVEILREHNRVQRANGKYKYAIIRFSNTGNGEKYRNQFKSLIDWNVNYICFHSKHMVLRDINQIVNLEPDQMTIIEVYHSLRAGIQLNTEHIFLVHDSYRAGTDVTAQGLSGRCCGYGKKKHGVEIYCYQHRLQKYLLWIQKGFNPEYVPDNCYNIKRGYTELPQEKFQARVPMSGKIPDHLIHQLLDFKQRHKNRYPKFMELFGSKLGKLDFIDNMIWNHTQTVGITILNEKNKTEGKTNTWIKFWNPAFKASQTNREGAYFRNCKLPEEDNDFKYIYINLKRDHKHFGYLIVTSQFRLSEDPKDYLMTTGKEEFHPKNNLNLNDVPVLKFKSIIDRKIRKETGDKMKNGIEKEENREKNNAKEKKNRFFKLNFKPKQLKESIYCE